MLEEPDNELELIRYDLTCHSRSFYDIKSVWLDILFNYTLTTHDRHTHARLDFLSLLQSPVRLI
jgi:hypothetical protein